MSSDEIKLEESDNQNSEVMEKQIQEITELCKKFSDSITKIEQNQQEVTQFVGRMKTNEEQIDSQVAQAISGLKEGQDAQNRDLRNISAKIRSLEETDIPSRHVEGLIPNLNISRNPATMSETRSSQKFAEALNTVSSTNFQFK